MPTKAANTGLPGLSRRTRHPQTLAVLAQLEEAHAGLEGVEDALTASTDPRAVRLAAMLADPQWAGQSLADICYDADISPSVVIMLLRDGAVARAVADAQLQLQRRLPRVMDRIADAAEGGLAACPCTVGGQKEALPDCPACRGTGQRAQAPSLPHQELVLDIMGLTSKGGGATVNVQQQVAVSAGGATSIFDSFVKGSSAALPSSRRALPDLAATGAVVD